MKRCVGFTFLFFCASIIVSGTVFADSPIVRQNYDEFRDNRDGNDHSSVTDEAGMAELYLVSARKSIEQGDNATAVRYLNSGRKLAPDDGRFSLLLGDLYARSGDELLAEKYLLEAVSQLPASDLPVRRLGDLYYQAGNLPAARDVLIKAQQISPGDLDLQKQIKQVQREIEVEEAMVQDVNSIFTVTFDERTHAELADRVIEILQVAYAEQGSLLNHYPQKTVQVILYSRDDYDMTTGAPAWSAGRFDGKIRIPIGTRRVEAADLDRILTHEYNHFLAQQISRGRAPAWIYEGTAMTAENHPRSRSTHFSEAIAQGKLLGFAELEQSFDRFERRQALLAYEQSFSFVAYLVNQFGWHSLKDLLNAYGRGLATPEAFASVFNGFGLDFPTLVEEWRAGL